MQTQVCKGSNHVRVIPQEKQKCYTHTYTGSIDESIMLDLNCAYTSCIYVKTRDGKKTLHTICWIYMSRARRIKNNSCLNLMAGTSCEKKKKYEISTNHACMLDLILYFLI